MTEILVATHNDLGVLATCHRAAFPNSLSTAMGQNYVEKMLEWYLVDERAFLFFLEVDGQCVGYCGGMKNEGTGRIGSASSMIQHSYNHAVKIFIRRPWLFLHPEFFPRYKLAARNVWRRMKKWFGNNEKVVPIENLQHPESHIGLIVIGVQQKLQGKGYGSMLLQEFERISKDLGFNKMMLTVKSDNVQAIRSYLRNKWIVSKVEGKSTSMEKAMK